MLRNSRLARIADHCSSDEADGVRLVRGDPQEIHILWWHGCLLRAYLTA